MYEVLKLTSSIIILFVFRNIKCVLTKEQVHSFYCVSLEFLWWNFLFVCFLQGDIEVSCVLQASVILPASVTVFHCLMAENHGTGTFVCLFAIFVESSL